MKKLTALILCVFTFLNLTSCVLFADREGEVGFFDDAILDGFKLGKLPTPPVENAEIRRIDNKIYFNLGDEEYLAYRDRVAKYLIEKTDIYYKGYHSDTGNPGGIFYIPEYRFSALREDIELTNGWFVFSLSEELNAGDEYNLSYADGVYVKVFRNQGKIGSFEYNVTLEIEEAMFASYEGTKKHEPHTWEYYTTEETHRKIFTCGCDTYYAPEPHVDDNKDRVCDVCKYRS